MSLEERVWRVVGVLVTIATMAIPLSITVDRFEHGGIPEKHVELQLIGPIDPLLDLSALAMGTSLKLVVGQNSYNNIVIWEMSLSNLGKSPINPSDFFENLRISVQPPWQIIGVGDDNRFFASPIHLKWKIIQATTMEADPFLFNPGDKVSQTIYVTSDRSIEKTDVKASCPKVSARITNLRDFIQGRPFSEQPHKNALVYLSIRDVLFLLSIASLFLYWYIQLLTRNGLLTFSNPRGSFLVLVTAALSYATAEVVTYYVFGGNLTLEYLYGRHLFEWQYQIQNWAILIVHSTVSIYLYRRSARKAAPQDDVCKPADDPR